MKIHYLCPKCEQTANVAFDKATENWAEERLACPHCSHTISIPADALDEEQVVRCFACPSEELFVRKDFPQQLGLAIIGLGFTLSSIAWYYYMIYAAFGVLFVSALIDAALYLWMGNVLTCYRCHAEYRGLDDDKEYSPFDLEIHERFRQQAARLADAEAEAAVARQHQSANSGLDSD
jgi:DNA-directed RNA polymerase subunit RPC12/RpoP